MCSTKKKICDCTYLKLALFDVDFLLLLDEPIHPQVRFGLFKANFIEGRELRGVANAPAIPRDPVALPARW